nr:MAG TPA: hypothetical protein [Caudoviricetes sp.]
MSCDGLLNVVIASLFITPFCWLVFYKINFENSGPSGPFIIHKNTF